MASLKREGLWHATTPEERRFFKADAPDRQATIDASWRAEALAALLWCLGHLDRLEPPTHECDFGNLDRICPPPGQSTTFIRNAKLVPKDRILALLSLVFDMHWASRDAMLKGKPVPASLNPSVLRERHHALNWLTFYCDEDWDDIATDT